MTFIELLLVIVVVMVYIGTSTWLVGILGVAGWFVVPAVIAIAIAVGKYRSRA
jgi:hypothetical protein